MSRTPVLDADAALTTRATALRRALHYEWRHLQALRSTWILLGAIAVLGLIAGLTIVVGLAPGAAPSSWSMVTAFEFDAVSMQLPLSALLLLPVATGPIATELTRGTARTTWLTLASRRTAFAAKLIVGGGLGAMTALGGALLVALSAMTALAVTGRAQPNWDQALPGLLGYTLFMTCWPVIAASVVSLFRNRVAAALMLILWPLLGERLAGVLLGLVPGGEALAGRLPFGAARAAMAAGADTLPEADRGLVEALVGSDLSAGAGAAVFVGFTMVMAALGAWSYIKKDAR
ncbi:ABC transporter permease [Streptomyces goshikiensis]|uniref:ABC transporter permease n=1 Tax=Streptomyces goshikiensis TaxID=1942 RepID=UPI0036C033B3